MLRVSPRIQIPDDELVFTYVRSSGPGGQNVNKVNTKALLRWDARGSEALPADVRERFESKFGSRLTTEGHLLVSSQRYRDQARNAEDCRAKLRAMLASVAVAPRRRRPTKPTRSAVARRLKSKQAQAQKKQSRRSAIDDD
jgi:ribosome-associated protein